METKPTAYHSLDEWVSESQISGAATIYYPSAEDKKAPTAQPREEDIDKEESPEIKMDDMFKTTGANSRCVTAEMKNMRQCEATEKHAIACEEEFPPPPPDFSDLPKEQSSSDQDVPIEVIAAEWLNCINFPNISQKCYSEVKSEDARLFQDGVIQSKLRNLTVADSTENDREHLVPSPRFADGSEEEVNPSTLLNLNNKCEAFESTGVSLPVIVGDYVEQQVELSPQCVLPPVSDIQLRQECFGDYNVEVGECEEAAEAKFIPDGCTKTASKSSPDYHRYLVHSQHFARENNCDEEDYLNTLHNSNCKTDVSKSTTSTSPVVDVCEQQEALSLQCELPPLGVNQEATQQVLSQASPPLSAVSMEPANHAAQSEGSAVVIGESRVGHGIEERESRQIREENRPFKVSETEAQIRRVLKSNQELKGDESSLFFFQHSIMESDSCDESDSGVSADFSPGSTLESGGGGSAHVHKETPIEREIRRAIEREHSLRRSRGLPHLPTAPEYVEIPLKKPVYNSSLLSTKSERGQGKDKLFAGKKMQQEIHEEARREQDLVKLGKIPGFYDKGTVRQLKEKKLIFEAFQNPKDSVKNKAVSNSNDSSTLENSSLCNKVTKNGSDPRNDRNLNTPKVYPESKNRQIIIIESNSNFPSKRAQTNTNKDAIKVVDSSKEKARKVQDVTALDLPPKENPFFKLRSSTSVVKVEQDIREAQEREREILKQRINLYGTQPVGEKEERPAAIEEHSSTLSSLKALPVQDLPDLSQNGVTTTTAARNSSGKLSMWPPAPTENSHQTKVHHCPRTPRQKTPLVQRWESGLFDAQDD
ncbi:hypothetical protein NL108_005003 [Boleophthalmus pectinirostris]|uniref:uncharacterized protein LOC129410389 n=1 Tax=Boleophthalmus pectinirostris TaxID=150288 RepID=UPI0024330846|nr:uncharacterized protein LOC129410389 [Boleophthalmus pectinirostris]KAJ0050619.1 hypothetical protein NL108_005003 [Boleophthalmus pectinirostris]